MSPHISIKGEVVSHFFGFPITNSFITTVLIVLAFSFIARYYYVQISKEKRTLGFYALHEMFGGIYSLFETILHNKINFFYSLLGAFFFFILLNNWSGLIPGVGSILITPQSEKVAQEKLAVSDVENGLSQDGHTIVGPEETHEEAVGADRKIPLLCGGTAGLNTTIALALVSVFMTQLYGFKFLGAVSHLKKYFDFRDPVMILLGPLEIVQEFTRIISFGFRLYGNIFAGEVLLTIVPFLLPVFLSFIVAPMFLMELFVGFVQALVFVMLSSVFISMSIAEHH